MVHNWPFAGGPVDSLAHLHQFLPGVKDVFEVGFQQISLSAGA